jgi:hypothetical protein
MPEPAQIDTEPTRTKPPRLTTDEVERVMRLRTVNNLPIGDIGKIVDRHPSTIDRVLKRNSEEYQALQKFKDNQVDLLDNIRLKNTKVRNILYDSLLDDQGKSLCDLPVDKRVQLIHPLTVDSGIDTEKSLLLQGRATRILGYDDTVQAEERVNQQLRSLGIDPDSIIDSAQDLSIPEESDIIPQIPDTTLEIE